MYSTLNKSSSAIVLTAAILSLSAPAQATDIYTPADAYSKPPISWAGITAGGAVGYGVTNYELDAPGFNFDGISGRGLQGCGIVGVQQQSSVFVFGAEGRACYADISTDLTIGAQSASLELDHSYSAYLKGGIAHGTALLSLLAGGRWQHYELSGPGFSLDDTVFGISGGILFEKKVDLDGKWNFGLETIFTQFDEQDAGIVGIDPTQFEGNVRLTYTFGN